MKRAHTWEDRGDASGTRHSWEQLGAADTRAADAADGEHFWGECSDDEADTEPASTPFSELIFVMTTMLFMRVLNARQFCEIMFWIGKCGISEANKWGFRPGAPSGHYARHLEPLLGHGVDNENLYPMEYSGYCKYDMERTSHVAFTMPAHEQIQAAVDTPQCRNKLMEKKVAGELPPCYYAHPVVQENLDDPVYPVAVYVDALPYSITDSVIGFWILCLLTGRRFLVGLLRKRNACKCGCRGWCSFHTFWMLLRWSLEALREGFYPSLGPFDRPFTGVNNQQRQDLAGKPLLKCACMYLKCDWSEHGTTGGFPSWQDGLRPCYDCNAFRGNWWTVQGCSRLALPWRCNGDDDYEEACRRCEIDVVLDSRLRDVVWSHLRFDRRSDGPHGLALTDNIPGLPLRVDDRLEPSMTLPNVADLEGVLIPVGTTILVTFWRPSSETLTRHRNPFFHASIGTQPNRVLATDKLHALNLGVFMIWCRKVVWTLILERCYAVAATQEEQIIVSLLAMRRFLLQWYDKRKHSRPDEGLTHVHDWTPKMVGTAADPKMKVKAAECWGVLFFFVDELQRFGNRAGPHWATLLEAGQCLVMMQDQFDNSPTIMPDSAIDAAFAHYSRHMLLMEPFEELVPKHHVIYHLLFKAAFLGNPRAYATWTDEALNKLLKMACRQTSQSTFDQAVLCRMSELLKQVDNCPSW